MGEGTTMHVIELTENNGHSVWMAVYACLGLRLTKVELSTTFPFLGYCKPFASGFVWPSYIDLWPFHLK